MSQMQIPIVLVLQTDNKTTPTSVFHKTVNTEKVHCETKRTRHKMRDTPAVKMRTKVMSKSAITKFVHVNYRP